MHCASNWGGRNLDGAWHHSATRRCKTITKYGEIPKAELIYVGKDFNAKKDLNNQTKFLQRLESKVMWPNAGNHGQLGMQAAKKKYPRHPKYKEMPVKAYGNRTYDHEFIRFLSLRAGVTNVVSAVIKVTSFLQKVVKAHTEVVAELTSQSGPNSEPIHYSQLDDDWIRERKADWKYKWDSSSSSIVQIWDIAKRTGSLWDKLYRMLKGEYVPYGAKSRRNSGIEVKAHYFVRFGGLDEETIEELIDRVLRGELSPRKLGNECVRIKARFETRALVLSKVDGYVHKTWEQGVEAMLLSSMKSGSSPGLVNSHPRR